MFCKYLQLLFSYYDFSLSLFRSLQLSTFMFLFSCSLNSSFYYSDTCTNRKTHMYFMSKVWFWFRFWYSFKNNNIVAPGDSFVFIILQCKVEYMFSLPSASDKEFHIGDTEHYSCFCWKGSTWSSWPQRSSGSQRSRCKFVCLFYFYFFIFLKDFSFVKKIKQMSLFLGIIPNCPDCNLSTGCTRSSRWYWCNGRCWWEGKNVAIWFWKHFHLLKMHSLHLLWFDLLQNKYILWNVSFSAPEGHCHFKTM